jgi:hypothetical protein
LKLGVPTVTASLRYELGRFGVSSIQVTAGELMQRGEGVEQLIQFGAGIFFAGLAIFA